MTTMSPYSPLAIMVKRTSAGRLGGRKDSAGRARGRETRYRGEEE